MSLYLDLEILSSMNIFSNESNKTIYQRSNFFLAFWEPLAIIILDRDKLLKLKEIVDEMTSGLKHFCAVLYNTIF